MTTQTHDVISIGGRQVRFSKPDKVLWPVTGTTKKDLLDYYVAVAPALLPHLTDRPVTFVRAPDGVEGHWWYQTECPHPPEWMDVIAVRGARGDRVWNYCAIEEPATLAWLVNLGCIEIHPLLAQKGDVERAAALAFDLDPGPGRDVIDCCRVALEVRDDLADCGLDASVKTSGSEGLHVQVPLDGTTTFSETRATTHAIARRLADDHPDLVTARMARAARTGKVFVDWQQNGPYKSLVAPYSVRLRALPLVSVPLDWAEVEDATRHGEPRRLMFLPHEAAARAA